MYLSGEILIGSSPPNTLAIGLSFSSQNNQALILWSTTCISTQLVVFRWSIFIIHRDMADS